MAQYNYVDERGLRRWADGYDTRLFVRRRIHETEPVVGVVGALILRSSSTCALRPAATPSCLPRTSPALGALGYEGDEYETLAHAEGRPFTSIFRSDCRGVARGSRSRTFHRLSRTAVRTRENDEASLEGDSGEGEE